MNEELNSRLSELLDRERELMIADVQAVMEGTDVGEIHGELVEIRAELKRLRRIQTMESKRSDPLLTERVAVRLSKDEYKRLRRQAEEKGLSVSDHVREIIRKTII